jgi:hypothetical protein
MTCSEKFNTASATGSSRALFTHATAQDWNLVSSPYALNEVLRNLPKLPPGATADWLRLRPQLVIVDDVVCLDRPILFTALAWADILPMPDKADFSDLLGGTFYGLRVLLPYDFLGEDRKSGGFKTEK